MHLSKQDAELFTKVIRYMYVNKSCSSCPCMNLLESLIAMNLTLLLSNVLSVYFVLERQCSNGCPFCSKVNIFLHDAIC